MVNEEVLLESRTLRESVAEHTGALDKVKALSVLPDGAHVTTRMVAAYFEVGETVIRAVVHDHRDELEANGYRVLTGPELSCFKQLCGLPPRTRSVAVFSRRTVLNVAMLLRDSVVARQVRAYLLDAERTARPRPVDNLFHIDLDALDERITRISTQTAGRLIGQTIVPMLNHLIHASGEQRRELTAIREDLERVKRTLQDRELTGAATAVDTMGRREFEDHVAGLCRRDGCTVTSTGSDSGPSTELVGHTADGRRLVVRCEHATPHRAVESGAMWEFAGMAKLELEAEVALFVTTSAFTPAALGLAARHGITAVHRALLEAWSTGTALQVLR
ncbi:restriction endonuclease [Streptomyces barkulensis]|uniref:restriction endonuclease n=1 Tax=Streptomyces barkulensis TaxID=1257026 RepID=UPI000C6D6D6C|nr:restriction endonuclease [Streptomyces barkulensis]